MEMEGGRKGGRGGREGEKEGGREGGRERGREGEKRESIIILCICTYCPIACVVSNNSLIAVLALVMFQFLCGT